MLKDLETKDKVELLKKLVEKGLVEIDGVDILKMKKEVTRNG